MNMDSNRLLKAGAAAGAAYASWKWLDDRHGITHDIEMARRLLPLRKEINELNKNGFNVTELWRKVLSKNPNKPALLYLDEVVTYQQVEDRSNQVSNWLLSKGLKRGDTVALLMENRPEFVISWLGMTKIGVKVALINTMIKQKPLYHCIKISSCKMLFFGAELADQVNDIKEDLVELGVMLFATSKVENVNWCPMVTAEIDASPTTATSPKFRQGIGMQDVFGYIYTSGTTGLPKAAVILHQKMFAFGALMTRSFKVRETDVVYTCLPLFHSAGGGLGIGIMLYTGATVVIKRKFSASDFWTDCIKYKCTVVQYIGELCRYLTLCDERPEETKHCVRLAIGNGLRPEIWGTFQERFNIPEIGEFYGATEGNGALVQHCTKPADRGSVGRVGSLMKKITGIKFAKFDVVEEKPIRGPDGFCIECAADEPGELLFLIRDDDPSSQFAGYNDPKATAKKIITDAFVKGDKYFRTGDLLSRDATGRVYFRDRIGDTFRCKGENVSTSEVAEVLSTFPGVEELNIYGVQIPNQLDGRFPAAAITPKDGNIANLDMEKLLAHAKKNLPAYAIPMFLRIQTEIAVTATLKLQKVQLRKEGMDINIIQDPMYWLHDEKQEYVPLTQDDYARIIGQRARL